MANTAPFPYNTIRISCIEFDKNTGKEYEEERIVTYDEIDNAEYPSLNLLRIVEAIRKNIKEVRSENK